MARQRYRVEPSSRVVVTARSSVHDTETVWSRISGVLEVDPDALGDGASAEIEVAMAEFDAGDWLKNRKIKKDLEVDKHPTATFRLAEISDLRDAGGETSARARGTIVWRGREAEIEATGTARVDASTITATARFELDVRKLGVTPPRILMLKVEDVVSVVVELRARV